MAEWLGSSIKNHLPVTAVGSKPPRDSEFFHVKLSYPASIRNVAGPALGPDCA